MANSPFVLPKNQAQVDDLIEKIHGHSEKKEFSLALAICQHLIIFEATRIAGYRERAEIWQTMTEHDLAVHDLQKIVDLGSVEPVDYYNLGIAELRGSEVKKAVAAFTRGIELGQIHQSSYYTQSCRFHRAAAFLRLGMPREAIEDCGEVEEGYRCFLPSEGMRSKEELVAQAQQQMQ
jgi:hypothetical protein